MMNAHLANGDKSQLGSLICLNLLRLPGRLTQEQAAAILGVQYHDIPTLIRAGLLEPLGKPAPNAQKYFASRVVEQLSANPDWLNKATRIIARYWQGKNKQKANPISLPAQKQDVRVAQSA
jgi:hypothetical protein